MAISINWETSVIFVPRADLTLVQSTPIEIRRLDINLFRLELKALEAAYEGMPFLKTHIHNTEVELGGITYARVVELLEPYTLTFEDGQYAVNLTGANSNLGDRVNVNQVSVRSSNAAGLISNQAIEYSSFGGGVTIDVINGSAGSAFPIGTPQQPSGSVDDAYLIATLRGLTSFYIIGDLHLTEEFPDLDSFSFIGESETKTLITIDPLAQVYRCEFENATITGTLDGASQLTRCIVETLNYVDGVIYDCLINGTIQLGGNDVAHMINCSSGIPGQGTPTIDMGGSGQALGLRNYNGGILIKNKTGTDAVSIDLNSGQVILDETVTNGTVVVRGIGKLTDNSNGATVFAADLMNQANISAAVWDEPISNHLIPGSTGLSIGRAQFAGSIHIDTVNGIAGTEFPIGTLSTPSSNLVDAITIAEFNNFENLQFHSDYTFPNGTYITNYHLIGEGMQKTTFTFESGGILAYCEVMEAGCTGAQTGIIRFRDCILDNLGSVGLVSSSTEVIADSCFFRGTLALPSNYSGKLNAVNCWALPDDSENPPVIDMGSCTADLQIRNWSGLISIKGNTQPNDIRVFLASGGVILDPTVTAGDFLLYGVGTLTNNSTSIDALNIDGLINKELVTKANWDKVWLDVEHGVPGTAFPIGTVESPTNNLADALTILSTIGAEKIHVHGAIVLDQDIDDLTIESHGYGAGSMDLNGHLVTRTKFKSMTVTGAAAVNSLFSGDNCKIISITNIIGSWDNAVCYGNFVVAENSNWNIDKSNAPTGISIDMNGTSNVGMASVSGVINISNSTNAGNTIGITGHYMLTLDASCTAGSGLFSGIGILTNNSGISLLDRTLPASIDVESTSWDDIMTGHQIPGSFGDHVRRIKNQRV